MSYTIEFQPIKPGKAAAKPNEWYVYDTYSDNNPEKTLRYLSRYRSQYRFRVQREREHNPSSTRHTAKFDSCVKSVKRRLKGVANPYAVCMAALGKKAKRKR